MKVDYEEMKQIENKLKENKAYVISSIDEKGHHVGRFKGFSLDANGDLIIEIDIDAISSTK